MSALTTPELLTFDEQSHTYRYQGVEVVSVTQAIKAAGLIEDGYYTEYSRQRGTAVHFATQLDDEGDLDEDSLDPAITPYVEAARKFRRDTGFVPELIESRFCLIQLGYAGMLDRYGHMGKTKVVLDYKTGPVRPWTRLQLGAYGNSMPNGASIERYAVQLKDDGDYKITRYPVSEFRQDLNDFLACVRVAQLQREMRKSCQ